VIVTDVDSLGDDSVSELLVNNDTDRSGVDVEDSSGLSVIKVVWHTFMDGTINNYINVITNSVGGEDLGDTDSTVLSEALGELGSSSCTKTVRVDHVKLSTSREGFLKRIRANDKLKTEANKQKKRISTKRQPTAPREAHVVKGEVKYQHPQPFAEFW